MPDDVFVSLSPEEFESYRPARGLLVVRRDPPETHAGRIVVIPKAADKRRFEPTVGTVLRLGPEERTEETDRPIPWQVAPGDRVVLDRYAGHDLRVGGEPGYVILAESDVLCVLG